MIDAERAQIFRDAINAVKAQAHVLLEIDLMLAADTVARISMELERQYSLFVEEQVPSEAHA